MAITEQQEARLADARTRARQDPKDPLLINLEDGRLMPNVPRIRAKPNYVIYSGSPKDNLETRMLWLQSMGRRPGARRVVNTVLDSDEAFDVGKATKEQLRDFAMQEYMVELNMGKDIKELRREVVSLAKQHQAMIDNSASKVSTAAAELG